MKDIKVYFVDDIINIVYNGKVIRKKLKNIIKKGNVICRESFMEEFMKILKLEKIKSKLFGDKIYVVKNSFYSVRDLYFLETMFLDLGFIKVIFLDIEDLMPDDNATFIEFNDTYLNIIKGPLLDLDYFKDIPKVLESINLKKNVYLFGSNKLIPELKINNKNLYYFDNFKDYIENSLLKINKCDG